MRRRDNEKGQWNWHHGSQGNTIAFGLEDYQQVDYEQANSPALSEARLELTEKGEFSAPRVDVMYSSAGIGRV